MGPGHIIWLEGVELIANPVEKGGKVICNVSVRSAMVEGPNIKLLWPILAAESLHIPEEVLTSIFNEVAVSMALKVNLFSFKYFFLN